MHLRRKSSILAVGLLIVLAGAAVAWLVRRSAIPSPHSQDYALVASDRAFAESYLEAAAGKVNTMRRECMSCHTRTNAMVREKWNFLSKRSVLSREAWAQAIPLQAKCGVCHLVPDPSTLGSKSWSEAMDRMDRIMEMKGVAKLAEEERLEVLHFYFTFSSEHLPMLAEDPDPARSPVKFKASVFGNPKSSDPREHPVLGHVQIVDLDKDGKPDVLVCDTDKSAVTWIHSTNRIWKEELIAHLPFPAHTQVVTNTANGGWHIVVACQQVMVPTDDPVGSVVLLVNDGKLHFSPLTILNGVPRVADVEPGDFDGDGNIDFVLAAYGFIKEGEVGWLENKGKYVYHTIIKRTGAIHVLPIDINQDGHLDFVALFAQEHEQISAFLNDGHGGFQEHVLFKAATPSFGSSGIQLVDLDQDGDMDILYTNGDNMDLPTIIPRPYHGVQWLENRGNLNFVWHDIYRFYGAYCAVAGDLNNDGRPDIVVTSMFNDWEDPKRASILWLENDGRQHFIPHAIAREPTQLISAAVGDLDGDGWLDIVASGMHRFPPFDRMARVSLWKNCHAGK